MKYGTHHERQRESSYPPPQNPGHTRVSGNPGAVQFERIGKFWDSSRAVSRIYAGFPTL